MSQVVSQEAIIRVLVEKGIFTKEEFLKMVEVVYVWTILRRLSKGFGFCLSICFFQTENIGKL